MLKVSARITNDEAKVVEVKYYQADNDFVKAVEELMTLADSIRGHISSLDIRHVSNAPDCLIDMIELSTTY